MSTLNNPYHVALRYFAYFKGDMGRLRAIARYEMNHKVFRKTFGTSVLISRAQLPFLNPLGAIEKDALTDDDKRVNAQIEEHKKFALQVMNPLIKYNLFEKTRGGLLRANILFAMLNHKLKEEASHGE